MRTSLLCASLITAFLVTACGGDTTSPSNDTPQRMRQAATTAATSAATPIIFTGLRSNYSITAASGGYLVTDTTGSEAARVVAATARLRFSDSSLSFDVDGIPGQVYRLYRAAFARTPDAAGLGYWIGASDQGADLLSIAQGFVSSDEFKTLYAQANTNTAVVQQYYANVLNRAGDQGGIDYWVGILDRKADTLAGVLASFSGSAENKAGTAGAVQNGIAYMEYGVNYPAYAKAFPLRTAYRQRISAPTTDYLTISGDCAGYASYTTKAPASVTFEGNSALLSETNASLGLTVCSPASLAWTIRDYFDADDALLGHSQSNSDYDITSSAQRSLPASAKVGDRGVYATQQLYADSSKSGNPGQRVLSYEVTADGNASDSAILKLSAAHTSAAGQATFSRSFSYRIGAQGTLSLLSVDEVYSNGLHLIYTVNPANAQPARLTVTDSVVGTGSAAVAGQTLTVNYTGWLYDPNAPGFKGKQFDSSAGRSAFSFTLGAGMVIQGWDQGMVGMKVGGKRTLLIPSNLGYGTAGAGGSIPGNAALVFDVELVGIK
ncbi:DUF4214 domain-containing protein [Pseudoduganella sp. FT55W]|uniref:peptidylprolyl isomerase n=1 Tax=Duganella rivi TaxID=2666083 RepID=A0A7X4K9U0_9BURK|nr:FKBP-type peptidyl-prolyl cis-trans isomerase [Duganella rivi]MYM66351.1 DUF4214 domain-containing protein [Duganella rivi]